MTSSSASTSSIKDGMADPAPLGLMGFGLTTILLNLHNAGLIDLGSEVLAMGICYGGLAQIIAGLMEWRRGNTFGMTAFISYGFFWIALVGIMMLPTLGLAIAATSQDLAWFLLLWGIFTSYMFLGTLRANRAIQFVFGTLAVLFFMLALGDATGIKAISTLAGLIGIVCGSAAVYVAMAHVLNSSYERPVVPLWPVAKKKQQPEVEEVEAQKNL